MKGMSRLSTHLDKRLMDLMAMKDRGAKIVGYIPNGYMPLSGSMDPEG